MPNKQQINQVPELENAHPKHDCHCDGKCRDCRCRREAEADKET